LNRLVEREARAAAVAEPAAGHQPTPLDAAATIHLATSLDQHGQLTHAPLDDSAIEPRAPIRSHAALDEMADRLMLDVHPDQSAARRVFVPAEMSDYITPP